MTRLILITLGICTLLFTGCKDDDDSENPTPPETTLYEKLGGETMVEDPTMPGNMIEQGRLGLRSVVDSAILVIAADPELMPYFETLLAELDQGNTTNMALLSENLTDFFAVATGAENFEYEGLDMVTAHDPATHPRMAQKADDEAFDAFKADVATAAMQNDVPENLIGELAELMETLREPIVQAE